MCCGGGVNLPEHIARDAVKQDESYLPLSSVELWRQLIPTGHAEHSAVVDAI